MLRQGMLVHFKMHFSKGELNDFLVCAVKCGNFYHHKSNKQNALWDIIGPLQLIGKWNYFLVLYFMWFTFFLGTILTYCTEWNTNSRNCHVAQIVINIVLRTMSPEALLHLPNIKEFVEAIIPYTGKISYKSCRFCH